MNLKNISAETGVFILRTLGWLANGQGQGEAAEAIGKVADGLESGVNVDEHLKVIAEAMKAGGAIPWADVTARLKAASAHLQS